MSDDVTTMNSQTQNGEKTYDATEALGVSAAFGSRIRDEMQKRTTSVADKVGDAASNLRGAVLGAGETKNGPSDPEAGTGRTLPALVARTNPIGLGLIGFAIGVIAGSLLPVSDMERRRLRPIGENVIGQAQAVSQDIVSAGKAVFVETAQSAASSALSSAQTHGREVAQAAKARNDTN